MRLARLVLLGEVLVLAIGLSAPATAAPYRASTTIATGELQAQTVALAKGKGKKGKGKGKGKRARKTGVPPNGGAPVKGKKRLRGKKGKLRGEEAQKEAAAPDAPPEPPRQLPPPPALPTAYTAVGIVPVQAFEVPEDVANAVQQTLLDEIDQLPGFRSVSPDDLQSDLVTVGLNPQACDRDVTCLAQAGRYGRSHLVLEPRLSALGGTNAISLRIIDTAKGQEITRAAEPLAEGVQEQALQIHRLVAQLLTPDAYEGNLAIQCDVDGAEVYLDDKLLGTTPLASQEQLHAGVHILRVSKVGYSDINRFVDVVYNRASTVQVSLNTATVAGVIVEMRSSKGFGALFIASQQPGWEIRVDGEPLGMTPLNTPMDKIPVGMRHITMKKAGAPGVAFDVEIQPGLRTSALLNITPTGAVYVPGPTEDPSKPLPTIDTLLHPPVPPPPPMVEVHTFPSWRTWTAVGLGGAGVAAWAASGYFANQVRDLNNQAKNLAQKIQGDSYLPTLTADQKQLAAVNQQGQKNELYEWITLGVGGGLAAVGAGFLIWDFVHTEPQLQKVPTPNASQPPQPTGTAAPNPASLPPPSAPLPAAPKASLHFAPILEPGGGGLLMNVAW